VRALLFACALALLVCPHRASWAGVGSPSLGTLESVLADNPLDFDARSLAVSGYYSQRQYGAAYYHAAWLAWLGPGEFRARSTGLPFLFDRERRDRAGAEAGEDLAAVLAAVAGQRMVADSCLGGTIAQQAPRLRKQIGAMLERAQEISGQASPTPRRDPVARMALVQLALSLDDTILLDAGPSDPSRLPILRSAVTGAEALAAWLPEAPGPRRTLSIIRARLAGIDGRRELWHTALAEAERAHRLDPSDPYLAEVLWTICLRLGDWRQAAVWQRQLEAAARVEQAEH